MGRPNDFQTTISLGDLAADEDSVQRVLLKPDRDIYLDAAYLTSGEAISAQDTNYNTIAIKDGTDTLFSMATGPATTGSDVAAGDSTAFTTTTGGRVDAGSEVTLELTKTGSGLAMPDCGIVLSGYYVR